MLISLYEIFNQSHVNYSGCSRIKSKSHREFSWDEQNMVHIKRAKDFLFIIWLTVDQ